MSSSGAVRPRILIISESNEYPVFFLPIDDTDRLLNVGDIRVLGEGLSVITGRWKHTQYHSITENKNIEQKDKNRNFHPGHGFY